MLHGLPLSRDLLLFRAAPEELIRRGMRGALEAGGKTIGVLADSLERAAMNRDHRNHLIEREVTLISPYDPSAGFNIGHAMQRNKFIYALAEAQSHYC
jgi:DNA processing protein